MNLSALKHLQLTHRYPPCRRYSGRCLVACTIAQHHHRESQSRTHPPWPLSPRRGPTSPSRDLWGNVSQLKREIFLDRILGKLFLVRTFKLLWIDFIVKLQNENHTLLNMLQCQRLLGRVVASGKVQLRKKSRSSSVIRWRITIKAFSQFLTWFDVTFARIFGWYWVILWLTVDRALSWSGQATRTVRKIAQRRIADCISMKNYAQFSRKKNRILFSEKKIVNANDLKIKKSLMFVGIIYSYLFLK